MTDRCRRGGRVTGCAVRRAAVIIAVSVVATLAPAIAWAHVTVDSARPNGDGTTTVVLSFEHGCADSPTVSLGVAAGEGVEFLSGATSIPGWTAQLISPNRINYQGDPVASGQAARVEIVTRLTGVPGQPIRFPADQRCASGDGYSWTDTAPGAQNPAPEVIATSAILAPRAVSADDGADRIQVIVGITALTVVLGVAGAALAGRRRPSA